jgi:exonuclease SbcD
MFTFIHAADIHLDSPLLKLDAYEGAPVEEFRRATRRALENLVQTALSEKVDFVLVAGDLFDGDWKDYNTGLHLVSQMSRLREAGIPAYVIAGNHDAASKITKNLRFPENVTLFPTDRPATVRLERLGVAVHGQSFASPTVRKNLARGYPAAVGGCYNIGLLHTSATGREGHEPYAPCTLEDLAAKGYDYWALGHVHQREVLSEDPYVVFPGNVQGRHVRETGPKGCYLVSVDDTGATELVFRPLDVARWAVAEVTAEGAANGYEVIDRVRTRLQALLDENEGMPLAVRLRIGGETAAHAEVLADADRWVNEIRSAALDAGGGRLWVEKATFDTRPLYSAKPLPSTEGALGELLQLFDELADDADLRGALAAELADVTNKLPRELKTGTDALRPDDPKWMAELLEQVRPMLIRRLLQKETDR